MGAGSTFSVRSIAWRDLNMLNVCDADLLGKTVKEGKLNMHISHDYFGGNLVGEEEALALMQRSGIINLAGKGSVEIAVENKLAAKEAVRTIDNVPFLMIYKFLY